MATIIGSHEEAVSLKHYYNNKVFEWTIYVSKLVKLQCNKFCEYPLITPTNKNVPPQSIYDTIVKILKSWLDLQCR